MVLQRSVYKFRSRKAKILLDQNFSIFVQLYLLFIFLPSGYVIETYDIDENNEYFDQIKLIYQKFLIFQPEMELFALLFIFRYYSSSIYSGHFLPYVSGQKLMAPVAAMPKMVKRMKWLIPDRVRKPMMRGAVVEATVPKMLSTPTEIFLTLVGQSSAWQIPMIANSMDIMNLKTKMSASCMQMIQQPSQSSGATRKMSMPQMMEATPSCIIHAFLLFILSMMTMRGQYVRISATLRMVLDVQISNPNWLMMRVGPQYMRKVEMLTMPWVIVLSLREAQRKGSRRVDIYLNQFAS